MFWPRSTEPCPPTMTGDAAQPRLWCFALALLFAAGSACGGGGSGAGQDDGGFAGEAATPDAGGPVDGAPEGGASPGNPTPEGGASPSDSAPDGAACSFPTEQAAPACFSSFATTGSTPVPAVCMASEPPQPAAGTIADGIYELKSRAIYGSCSNIPDTLATIVTCPGHWAMALVEEPTASGQVPGYHLYDYDVVQQGASAVLTTRCATDMSTGVENVGYTAVGGQLTLFWSGTGVEAVETYVKR
jgi:hypothetical protein